MTASSLWGGAAPTPVATGEPGTSGNFVNAAATVITMNGSTQGGVKGSIIELEDTASASWTARVLLSGTGIAVTPFS